MDLHMHCNEIPQTVIEETVRDRGWMANPEIIEDLSTEDIAARINFVKIPGCDACGTLRLFVATDPTEKPGTKTVIILVSGDKAAERLDGEKAFIDAIKKLCSPIKSEQDALCLAKLFIHTVGNSYPQYWEKTRFLSSPNDVPLREGETLPDELQRKIKSPEIKRKNGGYVGEIFVWTELGGILRIYRFSISDKGELLVRTTTLGENIGHGWLPK